MRASVSSSSCQLHDSVSIRLRCSSLPLQVCFASSHFQVKPTLRSLHTTTDKLRLSRLRVPLSLSPSSCPRGSIPVPGAGTGRDPGVEAEMLVLFINFQNNLSQPLDPCASGCAPGDGRNHGQERVGLGIPPGHRFVRHLNWFSAAPQFSKKNVKFLSAVCITLCALLSSHFQATPTHIRTHLVFITYLQQQRSHRGMHTLFLTSSWEVAASVGVCLLV